MIEWNEGTAMEASLEAPDGTPFDLVCTPHPEGERRLAVRVIPRTEAPESRSFRALRGTLEGAYYEKLEDVRLVLEWKDVPVGDLEWSPREDPGG